MFSFSMVLLFCHRTKLTVQARKFIITARKRSCGKVMFSEAFVCPLGGLCPVGSLSRGISAQGALCPRGSLSRGSFFRGLCPGVCPGSLCHRDSTPLQWKSGCNASYWNAFLLDISAVTPIDMGPGN